MENNNLKLNKSEIARQLNVDRRTVDKYLNGFNKSKHRSKPSKLDSYKEIIQELLNSTNSAYIPVVILGLLSCQNFIFH